MEAVDDFWKREIEELELGRVSGATRLRRAVRQQHDDAADTEHEPVQTGLVEDVAEELLPRLGPEARGHVGRDDEAAERHQDECERVLDLSGATGTDDEEEQDADEGQSCQRGVDQLVAVTASRPV